MCRAMEEMREKAWQEGRQEGWQEGERRNGLRTAQRMLAAGKFAMEEIAEYSSLSLDDVRRLATEPQK